MKFRRSAVRIGIGLGGLGVLVDAVTVFALFTFPQHFLAEAVARRFLETWFQPIATVGGNLAFYGIPLLAVIGGFYLVRVEEVTPRRSSPDSPSEASRAASESYS